MKVAGGTPATAFRGGWCPHQPTGQAGGNIVNEIFIFGQPI
jgi:hypothetical protein